MSRELSAEFIGTFTLVSAVCGAALFSAPSAGLVAVAFAVGLSVAGPYNFTTVYPTNSFTRYDALKSRLFTADGQLTLAMRAASITIARVSARQTSEVERWSRPAAGKDTARTCGGLRIRNTQRFGRFKEERPRRAGAFCKLRSQHALT